MTGAPRALADPAEVARRHAMLGARHVAPLAAFAASLRRPDVEVPDVDPLDGGTGARMLFLLEKPGPRTSRARGGTGFVSRDNPDPTAEASWRFFRAAGIDRQATVVWNTCPWWNGTIRFTAAERHAGLEVLPRFLDLLPDLRVAVCVGRQAGRARSMLEGRGLRVLESAHPSPQVRAANRTAWEAIPETWAEAARP